MEVSRERLDDRKASFKRGVDRDEATSKRKDEGRRNRKQKRINKLRSKREALSHGDSLEAKFDQNALLQTQNVHACATSLRELTRYLANRPPNESDEEMDADVTQNFVSLFFTNPQQYENDDSSPVLERLVQLCATTSEEMRPLVKDAMCCLINVTGCDLKIFSLVAVSSIIKAGYLDIMANHVYALHNKSNPLITPTILTTMWKLVGNLCIECPESRNAVLNSALCKYTGNGPCPNNWQSPLLLELGRLCSDQTNEEHRQQLLPALLQVVCGIVQLGVEAPPWQWTQSMWPFLLQIITYIPAQQEQAMNSMTAEMLTFVFETIRCILRFRNDNELIKLVHFDPILLLRMLSKWYTLVTVGNRHRIASIISSICSLPSESGDTRMALAFINTGWLLLMTQSLNHADVRVREKAAHFFSNMACEGFDFVELLVLPDTQNQPRRDTFGDLMRLVKADTRVVRQNALYAITMCFVSANNERVYQAHEGNTEGVNRATNLLLKMTKHYKLFYSMRYFLNTVLLTECSWVLDIMEDALTWNPKLMYSILEEAGLVDCIDEMINCTIKGLNERIETIARLLDAASNNNNNNDVHTMDLDIYEQEQEQGNDILEYGNAFGNDEGNVQFGQFIF